MWGAILLAIFLGIITASAQPAFAQMEFSGARREEAVQIVADEAYRYPDGQEDVWVLRGNCYINQGLVYARARQGTIWIRRNDNSPRGRHQITVYLERDVTVDQQSAVSRAANNAFQSPSPSPKVKAGNWLGHFFTDQEPGVRVTRLVGSTPDFLQIQARAAAARDPVAGQLVRHAAFDAPAAAPQPAAAPRPAGTPLSNALTNPVGAPPAGMRRLRAFPRSEQRLQIEWFPDHTKNEWVAILSGGVTIVIDGADKLGSIDVSTDRLVIWSRGLDQPDLGGRSLQRDDTPLEFYMEGNVEFRQADRVVTARSMYYNVREHNGIVLDAELLASVQKFEGKLRLQANELRQLSQDRFAAQGARFTTSRMGEPGYWIESQFVDIIDNPQPAIDSRTGMAAVDPRTGQPLLDHDWTLTASDDYVYVEGAPVFYWPTLSTRLEDPGFYLKDIRFKSDNVFGPVQILTRWDPYQLIGWRPIKGTSWDLDLDYLSERGPAAGTRFKYDLPQFLGLDGRAKGLFNIWGIHDDGTDNLGGDQRSVPFDDPFRGRVLWQHRQEFGDGWQLTAEAGFLSDRNFLWQYYPHEWWDNKDEVTNLELKRYYENSSFSINASMRVNDFLTQTQWLPRADHYWLGQPLLGDWFTWYEHSSAAYAQFRAATPPNPAVDPSFKLLPWEISQSGERLVTTQEIDLPFEVGPVKVVPYALGQLGHWGADLSGNNINRAYGQAGVRLNLPMWKVDPTAEMPLLNVHGLAHKVDFQAEFLYADASQDVDEFPLYDQLDDDSTDYFRDRYVNPDFGGTLPAKFDPRYYAIRSGLGSWVTSPSAEVVDDLMAVRLGVHQRWQTKRGLPGEEHIVDWITLDTDLVVFPDKNRDNFGSLVGLIDYDFRWHVGDRVTVLSDGIFDTFSQGQQLLNAGVLLHRPDIGSLYAGLRTLEGPVSAQQLITTLNYRMSPKWITSLSSAITIGGQANAVQQLTFTRIGESFLVKVGVYSDEGQGTVGAKFSIEPRFFRAAHQNNIDGIHVAPAGAERLE